MSTPLQGTESAAGAIDRVRYTHDAMIDLMLANPKVQQNELAKHFGYTPAWVSRIVNSDAFQARLAARKTEMVDPTIALTLDEKFKAIADRSLDVVLDKLHATPTFDMAVKALEVSGKALGYGARAANVAVQQNFVVAMPAKVEDPNAWAARHSAPQVIDVTPQVA